VTLTPDRDDWARLLDQLDEPPVGVVAEALADARDADVGDAYDAVEAALEVGDLVEEDTGSAFPAVRTPDADPECDPGTDGSPDNAEEGGRGAVSTPSDPQGEDAETPLEDAEAHLSGEIFHPAGVADRDVWVTWILDGMGRKRPVAPWQSGHAYPAKWSSDLEEEERPETDYDTASGWAAFDLGDAGLALPDDAQSDQLDLGIILPHDRADDPEDRLSLIDWDDVRDPETGEIHPVAADFINRYGGYVEVSTSGEGLHQFVEGGLRKRGKFIAPIDDEPFVGDDDPQVEIYDGGRHVAMTGRHVAGTGRDVIDGQAMIDELVTEYASAEVDAGHRVYDPETGSSVGDTETGGETSGAVPDPETVDYSGPTVEEYRSTKPDDRSFTYHVAVEAFYRGAGNSRGFAGIQNWRLEGFAAALGERDDLSPEEVKRDLGGRYLDELDVEKRCDHRTPERVDYAYKRAAKDRLQAPSWETLAAYGVLPPEAVEEDEEYRTDPREVDATVDPRRAWDAAGRVTPDQVSGLEAAPDAPERFASPSGDPVDVVRAVAIAEGLVDGADAPLDDQYAEAYALAREVYDAPLPEYYTTSDAIAVFDAVLDVIGEATYWDLDTDALETTETARDDDVGGDAVRALNPAWRESDSEASVLVFESGTVWDADTERVLDVVRFAALDAGIVDDPSDALAGEDFTAAYAAARDRGAPLPRWEPASDGGRSVTAQLPPAEELLDVRDVDGVDPSAIDQARADVEALLEEVADDAERPSVVTALPATGKTTGVIKTAAERPTAYLAPRKELQAQALDKADRWGVDARVLPVFSEARVVEDVLAAAKRHLWERGKSRLRDRWSVLSEAVGDVEDVEAGDLFVETEDDTDEVELDRATCPTAEGEHGPAWALAVHVARSMGYTPREIHTQARGLFGAELPCTDGSTCPYADGWEAARDPDNTPDLLVGSYIHAHVETARTAFSRGVRDQVDTTPRAVVLDEFPGEAFVREFGEEADDHATWLARSLREDVEDRRDAFDADLAGDDWVRAWLRGEGDQIDGVREALATLGRTGDLLEARDAAAEILGEVDAAVLEALGVCDPLGTALDGDAREAFRELGAAVEAVDPDQPGAGLLGWVEPAVLEPLRTATRSGAAEPSLDGIDTDELPVARDLEALVDGALEAARDGEDGARERLAAAAVALRGGERGCRRLAAWADDGYAHPDAHHLLAAVAAPSSGAEAPNRIHTSSWAFDPQATDGTSLDVVDTGDKATTVLDRNGHGALLHTPPSRVAAGGGDVPLVGLDATGRGELWSVAVGETVETRDIFTSAAERRAFLESALDLRVIQAAERPRYYEGSPASKDTDGDVALLETLADQYAGIDAPRERGDDATRVGLPAAITTKGVREVLEADERLDDVVSAWDNYGNVTGSNELGEHRLAAILGCQHFGDDAVERFAALAGESVETDRSAGRGAALAYGSELGEAYLAHMTEDQTTQAILRFARGGSGATVVARTSALGDDLPVVGDAQVVKTWSDTATTIAREYRRLGSEFTTADVREVVDVSDRHVRRVLAELADAGYVRRVEASPGRATTYERVDDPNAGDVSLPEREEAVSVADPGHTASNEYYTWNVRVFGGDMGDTRSDAAVAAPTLRAPPAPAAADGVEPPS